MAINSNFYIHKADKMAMDALKVIPGFAALVKAYMGAWDEKKEYIRNMATNLRINERQLSKYYNMLLPICERLGIEVPELYLTLDVRPNAFTYGDTKPYIVMTSGLLETVPEELIPSVLAHECGHIACHHCLYTEIGRMILGESSNWLTKNDLGQFATIPLQMAFYYWMRCSEYSADRAAMLCDCGSDQVVKTCLAFAGYDKDIAGEVNVDEFLNQAMAYKEMVDNSKLNKSLEFFMFGSADHPLNAVRAYEANEWGKTEQFKKIMNYFDYQTEHPEESAVSYLKEIPMEYASKYYVGKPYLEVEDELKKLGFTNITSIKLPEKKALAKLGQTLSISIEGVDGFEVSDWYPVDAEIKLYYYDLETEEEIAAAHPGQLRVPSSSLRYYVKHYEAAIEELRNAGFKNFEVEKQVKMKKGFLDKEGNIVSITINGQSNFNKDEWFDENAVIRIVYLAFM